MAEDYILPYQDDIDYWRKHINGMILKDYERFIHGNVLDVGCNHGAETVIISEMPGVIVSGIDINPEAIKIAKNLRPNINFYVHDICKNPVFYFDVIIALHVLEHLEYPEDAVFNILYGLEHYGYVIISVPYKDGYPSGYHLQEFDEERLKKLFMNFNILQLYRDQRTDGHGNQHDVLNLVAQRP